MLNFKDNKPRRNTRAARVKRLEAQVAKLEKAADLKRREAKAKARLKQLRK